MNNSILDSYVNIHNMSIAPPESAIHTADLDRVLQSHLLSGDTRKVIALLYGLQLTVREVSIVSLLPIKDILKAEEDFDEIHTAINYGYPSTTIPYKEKRTYPTLEDWLQSVEKKETNPLTPPRNIRLIVAQRLAPYDPLYEEMILQNNNPQRKVDILNSTSDNIYPDYDTSSAIEDPQRQYDYTTRLRSGKDYFREQDLRNNVGNLEEEVDYGRL